MNVTSAGRDSRMLIYKSLCNWAKTVTGFHRGGEKGGCSFGVNEQRDFSKVHFRKVKRSVPFLFCAVSAVLSN